MNKPAKPKNATKQQTINRVQVSASSYSGPLPPPEILEYYDKIIPGGADRIFSLVEKQAAHRQGLERSVLKSDSINSIMGTICGFLIGVISILAGTYCITQGHEWSGSFLGGSGLTGLVGVFVYGSNERRKERETRMKALVAPKPK